MQADANWNRTASEFLARLAPVCTFMGTMGGEDRSLRLPRSLRVERTSLKPLPAPESQSPPPQILSASLGGVRSPLLVCKWGDPVPSPERGGVARVYDLFSGHLRNGLALS